MTSSHPGADSAPVTIGDRPNTVVEKWQHNEALTEKPAMSRPEPDGVPATRRGLMTCQSPSDDELPEHLAADAALCDRLILQGCSGSEWELFAAALYRKATRVTYRWLIEGRLFAASAKVGRPVAPGDIAEWDGHDIRALAHEVVQETFTLFQKQLLERKYDASNGATLFTYFMNAVTRQFPNIFRRTNNGRKSWETRVDLHEAPNKYDQPDLDDYHGAYARYTKLLFSLVEGITSAQQDRKSVV